MQGSVAPSRGLPTAWVNGKDAVAGVQMTSVATVEAAAAAASAPRPTFVPALASNQLALTCSMQSSPSLTHLTPCIPTAPLLTPPRALVPRNSQLRSPPDQRLTHLWIRCEMASIIPYLMLSSTSLIRPKSRMASRPSGVRMRLPG